MGIDLPYSLGVIDRGRFWSCGQCPLDHSVAVLEPGNLERQLRLTAALIRDQFAPYGIAAGQIVKLVAYVVPDRRTGLDRVAPILAEELGSSALVIPVGVPHFYYDGMMVEIDVYAVPDAQPVASDVAVAQGVRARFVRSNDLLHAAIELETTPAAKGWEPGLTASLAAQGFAWESLLTARIMVDRKRASAGTSEAIAGWLGADAGATILADLPAGISALADLVFECAPPLPIRAMPASASGQGIRVVGRRAGDFLSLSGRCDRDEPALPEATRRIMEALARALEVNGLGFADVVKQQTHYVGGASAEDLYANMRVRNGYYQKPGPASTGLAVLGFADPGSHITIELLAAARW